MIALGLLAAVVLLLALLDVVRQRQRRRLAEWSATEWRQRAEAVCRVADRLNEQLAATQIKLEEAEAEVAMHRKQILEGAVIPFSGTVH